MQKVKSKAEFFSTVLTNQKTISNFGVVKMGLFGSLVRDMATEESDVDVLVEFEPGKKNYDNFIGLSYYLENILGRKVELLTQQSLSKHIGPHILKQVEYVSFQS